MNSLVTGLARQGAEISPGDAGRDGRAGGEAAGPAGGGDRGAEPGLLALHADETTWRVFAPGDGGGPAKFWLWVFIGPDTVCFVMDPSRSGEVLARHAGLDEDTGQLLPRRGRRAAAAGDVLRFLRRVRVRRANRPRAGQPVLSGRIFGATLSGRATRTRSSCGTGREKWLDRFRDLYAAHDELMAAWQDGSGPARGQETGRRGTAGEGIRGLGRRDRRDRRERKKQAQAPGLQEPAKKALATLDREWDGHDRAPGLSRWSGSTTTSPRERSAARS